LRRRPWAASGQDEQNRADRVRLPSGIDLDLGPPAASIEIEEGRCALRMTARLHAHPQVGSTHFRAIASFSTANYRMLIALKDLDRTIQPMISERLD
jgi:hypothetical protein